MTDFRSLTEIILWRAGERSERPCMYRMESGAARSLSWGELAEHIGDLLVGLDTLELQKGDGIGILAPNRWEWIALDLAAMGRGLVVVPIDAGWSDLRMVKLLGRARVRCVCVERAAAERLVALRPQLPLLKSVLTMEPGDAALPALHELAAAGHALRQARPALLAERLASVVPADIATIIHTGGSTGEPKGVVRTHGNTASRGWALSPWEGDLSDPPAGDELLFDPLSFCHSAGRWWCQMALASGRMVALPSSGTETLSLEELQLLSPTHIATVPRVVLHIQKLLMQHVQPLWERLAGDSPDAAARQELKAEFSAQVQALLGGRVRRIDWGGGPLALSLFAFFEENCGIALACGYGGTEAGIVAIQDEVRKFGTSGKPVGANVRIEDGEILVRGPGVTPGYYENPEASRQARTGNNWWRTGDRGRFDEGGNLVVMGRVSAMFNCNEGTNIDPVGIEQLLESDPYVSQAILFGDRRPYLVALLVVAEEARPLMDERIARINRDLEEYEKIKRFAILEGPFPEAVRHVTIANKIRIDRAAVEQTYGEILERLYH